MSVFKFKQFEVRQSRSAMKIGTDAMILGSLINAGECRKGLDIGSGTGVLALMVAQKNPGIEIDAVEIDLPSFEECGDNFSRSKWSDRLRAVHSDILDFRSEEKYDVIFSNPPYYQNGLLSDDERRSRARHNEYMPLEQLSEAVNDLLTDNGSFMVILPKENESEWMDALKKLSLRGKIDIHGKRGGKINRVILEFRRESTKVITTSLVVREIDGSYTETYKKLTIDYHANSI